MIMKYDLNIKYNHIEAEEYVCKFYNWLTRMAQQNLREIETIKSEDLNVEFKELIRNLFVTQNRIEYNEIIWQLNIDSIERLKIIIESYKDEYKEINRNKQRDIVFFNSLIGWYEDIPEEINMFINNLFNKQDDNDYLIEFESDVLEREVASCISLKEDYVYNPVSGFEICYKKNKAYEEIAADVVS